MIFHSYVSLPGGSRGYSLSMAIENGRGAMGVLPVENGNCP